LRFAHASDETGELDWQIGQGHVEHLGLFRLKNPSRTDKNDIQTNGVEIGQDAQANPTSSHPGLELIEGHFVDMPAGDGGTRPAMMRWSKATLPMGVSL